MFPLKPSPYLAAHSEGGSFSSCTHIVGPGRPLTLFLAIDQGHSVPNSGMPHLSLFFANRSIVTRAEFTRKHRSSIFRDTRYCYFGGVGTGKYVCRMHDDRVITILVSMDNIRGKKVDLASIARHSGNKAALGDSSVSFGATMITSLDAVRKQARSAAGPGEDRQVAQLWQNLGGNRSRQSQLFLPRLRLFIDLLQP